MPKGQKTMRELLVEELRDIYNAEQQAVRAYPRLTKMIQNEKLRQAMEQHLEQTRGQVERLQQAFEKMDMNARGRACHAMEGLIEEAREVMDMDLEPATRDAALIAAAQKIEHYEIASYGTVVAFAEACGLTEVAELLRQTLDEEKQTDELLNQIATSEVNQQAVQGAQKAA